uniref:Tyrosyl-DNA phosphodiesterase 1 n=1 Tax=Trichuris muris TaxID=70415 RepID=A0A5S6R368_TRIMR
MPKHRQGTAVGDSEEPYEESEKQPSVEECSEATSPKLSKRSKTSFSTFNSAGADYGLYLTKVALLEEKWNAKALSLADVLEQNSEELERSVQFNFMIDPEWLISCYPQKCRHLPLLIVTSRNSSSWEELTAVAKNAPNVQLVDAPLPIPYGSHHSKMILLKYSSGVRVVIHTANLIHGDWFQKTQGMYLSPIHPPIVNEAEESDSPTNFKKDLLAYLRAYKHRSILEWCDIISKHDFRQAKVYVVGSVPGRHVGENMTNWGHTKLRHLLNKHLKVKVDASWPLICQFSSIGSLGVTPERWLLGEFANSLKQANGQQIGAPPNLKLIYPSVEDVRRSLEGYEGGGCLPYSFKTAFKQEYLKRFLHRWRSECNGRSLACPHIKSYLRCNATFDKLAWFLLTSANLSKAAWGSFEKNCAQIFIRSFEIGVLFLPQLYNREVFALNKMDSESGEPFPMPYDLPPQRYDSKDEPWIIDVAYLDRADSHGNHWDP